MLCPSQAGPQFEPPRRVTLPRTSTRLQVPEVYVKIVEEVRPEPFGCAAFVGYKLLRPGAAIEIEQMPRPCVALECTGPIGAWQRGKKRERGYILWRYDFQRWEWVEISRAQSLDASWSAVLREPAIRALHPRPELVDVIGRSHDLTDELVELIEQKLVYERPDVRKTVLSAIYERVAGRIVDCA